MKILFYATYPTASTGYSRIGNILSNFLAESGHDVYYFGISNFKNNDQIKRYIHPKITLLDALEMEKMNGSDELFGVNVIMEVLKKIKPDILFLYNDTIVISRIFNNFIESKFQISFKTIVYLDLVYDFQKIKLINHIDRFSDLILVFSDYWKNNLMDMGVNENKIKILYHGFDKKLFYPLDTSQSKIKFGFTPNDFIILNTNKNNYRKGIDKTIDAFITFLKIKNCDPRIKLFLNMECSTSAKISGYDIYNLMQISCIRNKISYDEVVSKHIFINNGVNNLSDEMMNYLYNACDVGINTCVGEGFGLCNLEHGGIGKPQIISGVGALNDIFTNEYSTVIKPVGEIYIPNNIEFHGGYIKVCSTDDFVDAMIKYFDNSELKKTHGEMARNVILDKYSWQNILNTLNNIIENIKI